MPPLPILCKRKIMTEENAAATSGVNPLAGSSAKAPGSRKSPAFRVALLIILLALGASAVFWWYRQQDDRQVDTLLTVAVKRGDLVATISATGTVEPEEVVDVGAQVAGKIVAFGKDKNGKTIDYGSAVEEGTVLAQIDDALYAADAAQAKAQVAAGQGRVWNAPKRIWDNCRPNLSRRSATGIEPGSWVLPMPCRRATSTPPISAYDIAKANLAVGNAAIVQAKEAVAQAEATLQRAEQNLDYCTIKSPVKGVIIDRRVNIGQTVVASLNAPSLFLIAKDLKRLQVWVAVNEADIGSIHPGQAGHLYGGCFPRPGVSGRGRQSAAERHHDAKCGDLHGGGHHG